MRILITPAGTSEACKTSANEIALNGLLLLANITEVFQPTNTGAITETNPNNPCDSGATIDMTPMGSGAEKLK